jgi:hypothetical protein
MFDHSANFDVCVKPVTHRSRPFENFLRYLYKVIYKRRQGLRDEYSKFNPVRKTE